MQPITEAQGVIFFIPHLGLSLLPHATIFVSDAMYLSAPIQDALMAGIIKDRFSREDEPSERGEEEANESDDV